MLNKPIVGMAPTPDGKGYWLVASDGGIFTFGDAGFFGSTGQPRAQQARRRHGAHPRRQRLLAGGLRRRHLQLRRHHVLRLTRGRRRRARRWSAWPRRRVDAGYWMLEANGTVQGLRGARNAASAAPLRPASASAKSPMTAIIPSADGQGYSLVDSSGQAFTFGDAPYFGDVASTVPGYSGRVVGIAASPG